MLSTATHCFLLLTIRYRLIQTSPRSSSKRNLHAKEACQTSIDVRGGSLFVEFFVGPEDSCFMGTISLKYLVFHTSDEYIKHFATLYSQITGNTESSIPWYPPPLFQYLPVAYVHVYVITSRIHMQSIVSLDAHSIVTSTCMYANEASYVTCQQNTAGNCPSSQLSIRLVLSFILMIVLKRGGESAYSNSSWWFSSGY